MPKIFKFIIAILLIYSNITLAATFEATAYDLLDSEMGITANGYNLIGKDWYEARTIAVDTDIIPLGTAVYITFPEEWSYMDGLYTARDTGGAINGNIVDIYFGYNSEAHSQALNFGRRNVELSY